MRVRIYLAREVIRRVWRPRVLRTAVGALWCAGGGCIGVVLGLGRVLTYWAAGALEGWIRGCGGGSEGVTPDVTPNHPNHPKMAKKGQKGDIRGIWAYPCHMGPNGHIQAQYGQKGHIRAVNGLNPRTQPIWTCRGRIWPNPADLGCHPRFDPFHPFWSYLGHIWPKRVKYGQKGDIWGAGAKSGYPGQSRPRYG